MLATSVGNIDLETCLYNASGPRTGSVENLTKLNSVRSGAILTKSATLEKHDADGQARCVKDIDLGDESCPGGVNTEGVKNNGIDYYLCEKTKKKLAASKPYIISISGESVEENLEMFSRIMQTDEVTAVELNLACAYISDKPMVSYDFDQMDIVLHQFTSHSSYGRKPFGIKLAPYLDIAHVQSAAAIIAKYPINYVVTSNTIGNALFVDVENECPLLQPEYGGLSGGYVKHTALANVRMLHDLLAEHDRDDIDIVGVGGIASGSDAFEFILCGAKAVQIGTCHWVEGPTCFDRIANELEEVMRSKGYAHIGEFCGKLKEFHQSNVPARKLIKKQGAKKSISLKQKISGKDSLTLLSRSVFHQQLALGIIIFLLVIMVIDRLGIAKKIATRFTL